MTRLSTPVLFLIFNRPDTTQKVFNEIRKAQPRQLFVAADGPRKDKPEDLEKCNKTREIIQQVDWECEVLILCREENLGCKIAISSAIDWFFSQVDEGIILEDDCVPDQSFFPYCEELLMRYRNDERIMVISGNNFLFGEKIIEDSYFFSRYPLIWGWATWRRAWDNYDVDMKLWPKFKQNNRIKDILQDTIQEKYWEDIFDNTYSGNIDTWDYQWTFCCWIQNGLSVIPQVNLVTNIGFDEKASHTKKLTKRANMPVHSILKPFTYPHFIISDADADRIMEKYIFPNPSLFGKIIRKIVGSR